MYQLLFKTVLILSTFVNSSNITNILEEYYAACGPNICDRSKIPESIKNIDISGYKNVCPKCHCNKNCFSDGNCCPDVYYSINTTCVNLNIVERNPQIKSSSVLIVDTCPSNFDSEVKELCEKSYDDINHQLINIPVTSLYNRLVYRNEHCAKCHNESSDDLVQWQLEIQCAEFADFNFLSSYVDIVDTAADKQCNIFFSEKTGSNSRICTFNKNSVIQSCNISGTWAKYDPDIEYACETYDQTYSMFFKNFYCYLCNPPRVTGHIISQCNETGRWEIYDYGIELACRNTKLSTITLPYKNIYCFVCNQAKHGSESEIDTSVQEYISVDANNMFNIKLIFGALNYSQLINTRDCLEIGKREKEIVSGLSQNVLKGIISPNTPQNLTVFSQMDGSLLNVDSMDSNTSQINFTKLVDYYLALTGQIHKCCSEKRNCHNGLNCHFNSYGCCLDAFQKPIQCTTEDHSVHGFRYRVYESCESKQHSTLYKQCHMSKKGDLLTFLPVAAWDPKENVYVHYKNIYCDVCSDPRQQGQIYLWNLVIKCDIYLPTFYFETKEYYRFVQENHCQTFYDPPSFVDKNTILCSTTYSECNETGLWQKYDYDVAFACEKLNSYTFKEFCSLCNPENDRDILYSTCNQTGLAQYYMPQIEHNCLNLPEIQTYAPYKNIFCQQCNIQCYQGKSGVGEEPIIGFRSYRVLFSVPSYEVFQKQDLRIKQCNGSQAFITETGECKELLCYPGRYLMEGHCVPLIELTTNLGYILAFGIKGILIKTVNKTDPFLKSVEKSIYLSLIEQFKTSRLFFDSLYLLPTVNCDSDIIWENGTNISVSVYLSIFISSMVNRTFTEKTLLSFINDHQLNISHEGTQHLLFTYSDEDAFHIPSEISKIGFTNRCFLKNRINSYLLDKIDSDLFVHSHVNKLLICEQVELTGNKFIMNKESWSLKFIETGVEINHDQYFLTSSNTARVCLNTYRRLNINDKTPQLSRDTWATILRMCTLISLVCMFITFLTYCLFSSLRTLPGKNNMCLIVSMFCAHTTLQVGIFETRSAVWCKIVAVLIHYFWLTTFACLNICSYHMYIVFKCKTFQHPTNKINIIRYILYSYGLPALIVLLNILTNVFVSDYAIGYGNFICFIEQPISLYVTFVAPIVFVCATNIFFFVAAAVEIANRPKVRTDDTTQSHQVQFSVYLKLFSVTGITWILQIIDSFFRASGFSIAISLINSMQGVFIFFSFVCNRRVFYLYKNRFYTRKPLKTNSRSRPVTRTTLLNKSDEDVHV